MGVNRRVTPFARQYSDITSTTHTALCPSFLNNPQTRWTVYSFEMRQSEIALDLRKNSLIQVIKFHDVALNYLLT